LGRARFYNNFSRGFSQPKKKKKKKKEKKKRKKETVLTNRFKTNDYFSTNMDNVQV